MHSRLATPEDADAIAHIYNQGIEDRSATFEIHPRTRDDVARWFDGVHPLVVVEDAGAIVAYGATFAYSSRDCYRGVADFGVYVARGHRGKGAGKLALAALYDAARRAGLWKLVSRIFPENAAVRRLNQSVGVREVGLHRKHAQLDGAWRDVIVVEWLIEENMAVTHKEH
jgi:phosphinothricin acetyltransferase